MELTLSSPPPGVSNTRSLAPREIKHPFFCKCLYELAGHLAFMFREDRSVSQASLISLRTAETSLSTAASFGNRVATRVRRLISLLSRSSPLLVGSLLRRAADVHRPTGAVP